jgi:hypothetical protein
LDALVKDAAVDAGDSASAPIDTGSPLSCGIPMPNPATTGLPHPMAYDTSLAGTALDKVTGLMWERSINGHAQASLGCTLDGRGGLLCPFRYAAAYCTSNSLGGFADWRLPTETELVFAIAPTRKSQWNLSFRKWRLLPETALARHRPIGGHASCLRIALPTDLGDPMQARKPLRLAPARAAMVEGHLMDRHRAPEHRPAGGEFPCDRRPE